MAWDTERTRRLLLEAAVAHFAAVGLAGGRVDAVARAAGVNKERIYQYFGSKEGLFVHALAAALEDFLGATVIEGRGPDAVGAFAGRLVDAYAARPDLARLLAWEGLERGGDPVGAAARTAGCAHQVAALRGALPGLGETDGAHLLLTLVAIATSWWAMPQLPLLVLGEGRQGVEERRTAVVAQVTALAAGLVAAD